MLRRRCFVALILALCSPSIALALDSVEARELEIFGWVERVELLGGALRLKAKLDTGAATSSLDATEIERFSRDGKRWVRFVVTDPETGEAFDTERPVARSVRIVRHDGEYQRRPVVMLSVCFGPFLREVEFSLVDRGNFIYPVLLGRSALDGYALVDSSATFTNYPDCEVDDIGSNDR